MKKLTYSNNWESDLYKVGGKEVRTLKSVMIGGKTYKVTAHEVSAPYLDMGQRLFGISTHYFVKENVFGLAMSFDLNKIIERKAVYAVDYTVKE